VLARGSHGKGFKKSQKKGRGGSLPRKTDLKLVGSLLASGLPAGEPGRKSQRRGERAIKGIGANGLHLKAAGLKKKKQNQGWRVEKKKVLCRSRKKGVLKKRTWARERGGGKGTAWGAATILMPPILKRTRYLI